MVFKDKYNKANFIHAFKETNFGQKAKLDTLQEKRKEPQPIKTNTTFTCVVKGIPQNTNTEELKNDLTTKFLLQTLLG